MSVAGVEVESRAAGTLDVHRGGAGVIRRHHLFRGLLIRVRFQVLSNGPWHLVNRQATVHRRSVFRFVVFEVVFVGSDGYIRSRLGSCFYTVLRGGHRVS